MRKPAAAFGKCLTMPDGRGMGSVGGAKGVVHVELGEVGELRRRSPGRSRSRRDRNAGSPREGRRRLRARRHAFLGLWPTVCDGKADRLSEKLREALRCRLETHVGVGLTLRAAEVRRQDEPSSCFNSMLDCGQSGPNAGVVLDPAVLEGHVEVDADEEALSVQV